MVEEVEIEHLLPKLDSKILESIQAYENLLYTFVGEDLTKLKTKGRYFFVKCPNPNHPMISIRRDHFCNISLCKECNKSVNLLKLRFTQQQVEDYFSAIGYTLLSEYKGSHKKVKVQCHNKEHPPFEIVFANFSNGSRCNLCNSIDKNYLESYGVSSPIRTLRKYLILKERASISLDTMVLYLDSLKIEGLDLKAGVNLTQSFKCSEGHIFRTTFRKIRDKGVRCQQCYLEERTKITLEVAENILKKNKITILETGHTPQGKFYLLKCSNSKHKPYRVGHSDLFYSKNNSSQRGCPSCNAFKSIPQKEIIKFLEFLGVDNIHDSCRGIIKHEGRPWEIDIYLPEYNFGIEYHGLYWHSEPVLSKRLQNTVGVTGVNYHKLKYEKCRDLGISLFQVFDDEWVAKREIVESMLRVRLGFCKNRIYGRQTKTRIISKVLADSFCEENHLQGITNSSIRYGLFYNKELVSVATFGIHFTREMELKRFCSKKDTIIIGGLSKLMKVFHERNPLCSRLLSYSDLRYSSFNSVYTKTGFKLDSYTPPNYYYILNNRRIHRFNFRKNSSKFGIVPNEFTEKEFRMQQGYLPIYDAGNAKYFLNWI